MRVPTGFISLTTKMILKVQPLTHLYLRQWKERAGQIPDPELRKQALASIATKTFHCEGGALYGLLAGVHYKDAIAFIVAYQTISDYLDNLCDRSTSQDPEDFRALHESMLQALSPDMPPSAHYRFRRERDDGTQRLRGPGCLGDAEARQRGGGRGRGGQDGSTLQGSDSPVRNVVTTQGHADVLGLQEDLVAPGAALAPRAAGLGAAEGLA